MITERDFAASFHDFWRELLPLLTPAFVHVLNSGHEERIIDANGEPLGEVPGRENTRHAAVVSEFAYHLVRAATDRGVVISKVQADEEVLAYAQTRAIELVNLYEGRVIFPESSLNRDELDEGLELAHRYEAFIKQECTSVTPTFSAPVRGAGFISACAADMSMGDYLIEVKTVRRKVAGKDIRQLLVYLALGAAEGHGSWEFSGFLNPRRSTYYKLLTSDLIGDMSGGRAAVDVYAEIIDFACSSDVQLDAIF